MTDSYKKVLHEMLKSGELTFSGPISDTRLDIIISTIRNGRMEDK